MHTNTNGIPASRLEVRAEKRSSAAITGEIRGSTSGNRANDDRALLAQLRSGNEEAFRRLYRQHQKSLVGVALHFVRDRATAEELVQDTWLAVVEGLSAFEGRSSLKNWIFAILANKARSRAVRDARFVTAGNLESVAAEDEPFTDPSRAHASDRPDPPEMWDEVNPERIVFGRQMLSHVIDAIDKLPAAQRSVLILRDVEQMETTEICKILGVSGANQRVLLHRARAQVRRFIEQLLATGHTNPTKAVAPFSAVTPRVFGISPRVTPMIELKELI